MLEVVIPGKRHGLYKASGTLVQGTVGFISGMDTSGYMLIKAPSTGTEAAVAIYPFKKYYYDIDLNDTAATVNNITSGDRLVVFEGGEYITDKYISSGVGAIGSSTSQSYYTDYAKVTTAKANWGNVSQTDTAAYTEGGAKMVFLFPSTASGYEGYLRISTASQTTCALERFNRNFLLVRAWTRGYSGLNRIHFRVVAPNFNGMFWTGTSVATYYNVATKNG